MSHDVLIDKVRRAVGRREPLLVPPIPPAIDEPITRLVHTDIGLPQLFLTKAAENHILVETSGPEEARQRVVQFLKEQGCRRIAMPASKLLAQLRIDQTLAEAGFEVKRWDQMTLDELYEMDCGVTDVFCAVAEVGGLVMRASAQHGRALSLVPPIHVAIVEPADFVPDLVDLCEKLTREGTGTGAVMITGPSKTADIEMNIVVGVHGPKIVKAIVLQ